MFLCCSKDPSVGILAGPDKIITVKIAKITQTSPDTKIFRFALPDKSKKLGLPVCQHIRIVADIDGSEVFHSYTPIAVDTKGFFDCVIKIYPEGRLTQYLDQKSVGDSVNIYGPVGKLSYKKGNFVKTDDGSVVAAKPKSIAMVAGGSGITPMYQIMQFIADNKLSINCQLLFSNKTESDILIQNELDNIAKHGNMEVQHTLTRHQGEPPKRMKCGRVNSDMMKSVFRQPDLILACGPPQFNKAVKEAAGEAFPQIKVHVM